MVELRRNVETFSSSWNDPAAIVSANDALAKAAQKYADVVFELTGWGNPFVLQEEGEEDDGSEEGGGVPAAGSSARTVEVVVNARYGFEVRSFEELRQYVITRNLPVEKSPDREEGEETDYIQALFEADGWKPWAYPEAAIGTVDHEWQIQSNLMQESRSGPATELTE